MPAILLLPRGTLVTLNMEPPATSTSENTNILNRLVCVLGLLEKVIPGGIHSFEIPFSVRSLGPS